MKRFAAAFMFIAMAASVYGQRTITEITKSTSKQEDEKANSDAVPDVYAIRGDIERVVVLRFKFKTDLLAGLNKAIAQERIKNGVILAGAGSVRGYHYHSVSNREFPSKNLLVKDPTHPADIASMNGYIVDGRAHPHITFTDEEKAFGGHLEPGTQVFTFAAVTIGVFSDDVDLARVDDKTHR
jgi:predicted DNA-binding protein with PD1-like motif